MDRLTAKPVKNILIRNVESYRDGPYQKVIQLPTAADAIAKKPVSTNVIRVPIMPASQNLQ